MFEENKKVVVQKLVPIDMGRVRYVNVEKGEVLTADEISISQVLDKKYKTFYLVEEVYE